MKDFTTYINEGLTSNEKFFCETFVSMFKGIKFTKESVKLMLNNLDMKLLSALSQHFNDIDSSNYMSYEPNADLFNSDTNKDKITSQLSEYIAKFIAA